MLLPALSRAKAKAHSIACMNNGRQLGLAWLMYADDQDGRLANAFDWTSGWLDYFGATDNTNIAHTRNSLLGPYLQDITVFKCPADQSRSKGRSGLRASAAFRSIRCFAPGPKATLPGLRTGPGASSGAPPT